MLTDAAGIVPLEQLLARAGTLTATNPGSAALQTARAADLQAVTGWLALHLPAPHTWRTYRRAAERLLLWCHVERHMPLLSLGVEDAASYRQWLQGLGRLSAASWAAAGWRLPAEAWLSGQARTPRGDPAWRPFAAAPSSTAQQQDLVIVKALFGHLRRHGSVPAHPFDPPSAGAAVATGGHVSAFTSAHAPSLASTGRAQRASAAAPPPSGAVLGPTEWDCLLSQSGPAGLGADTRIARALAVLWLGHGCGLRAAEMLALTLGDLHAEAASGPAPGLRGSPRCTWSVSVGGPGDAQQRRLPLPDAAARAVFGYLQCLGLAVNTAGVTARSGNAMANAVANAEANAALDPAWWAQPLLRAKRGRPGRVSTPWPQPARPMSYSSLQRDVRRHVNQRTAALALLDPAAAARLRGVTTQWLRDGFAAQALRAGQPLPTVASLMGQSSVLATARRYAPAAAPWLEAQDANRQHVRPKKRG